MNDFGRLFRVTLYGESHGPAVGVILDGVPPGLSLAEDDFSADLSRRRGGPPGSTTRAEPDRPRIRSGLYHGHSTGTPLAIEFENTDTRPGDYSQFERYPRPGHADLASRARYLGWADPRGSGHFSGRLTVGVVAAGVVAKKLLPGVSFRTLVLEAGGRPDVDAAIQDAQAAGDSVGSLVEIRVDGLSSGLGEPYWDGLESRLAAALFAVPGVRGVEFGDGFRVAAMLGSQHNDPILDTSGRTERNGAGGVNGGVGNGNQVVVRVAFKPPSSIALPQDTVDMDTGQRARVSAAGRHDACLGPRGAVVLEAACAIVLADLALAARCHAAPGSTP